MSKRQQVLAVLQEAVDQVKGLPLPVIQRLMPPLLQAQTEIRRQLLSALSKENGEASFTTQRYRNVMLQLDPVLKEARAQLQPNLKAGLERAGREAGKLAMEQVKSQFTRFALLFEGTVQPLDIDTAATLIMGESSLIERFERSSRYYAGTIGESVKNELAVSRLKNETLFETTNRLQRNLPSVFDSDRKRAWSVARSETMEAYNLNHFNGVVAANEEDPSIKSRWDASFDSRRCPICQSLDGQVKDIANGEEFVATWTTGHKGKVVSHQMRFKRPTAHSCCRCVLTPWRESWAKYLRPTNEKTLKGIAA